MFSDETFRHVKVELFSDMPRSAYVEKFHEAACAKIGVQRPADRNGNPELDISLVLEKNGSADDFKRQVMTIARLCEASFLLGKQQRSREFRALTEDMV